MLLKCFRLEDIDWSGDNIKVMGHVTVTPPYKPDNVRGVSDSKAVMHVRKIVSVLSFIRLKFQFQFYRFIANIRLIKGVRSS